jgi:hypothetical protein
MFRSLTNRVLDLTRISERRYVPQIGVLLILLMVAFSTGCGNSVQASNGQTAQSLHLSATFPSGMATQAYNAVISVSGGSAPYHFSVRSGSIPAGLTLNTFTGSVSGAPTTAGTYSFEIAAIDASFQNQGSESFSIHVVPPPTSQINVSISPASVTLASGHTQQFTAAVTGTSNTAVTWTASAGSIDATGLYTAPAVTTQTIGTISAASKADPSRKANATATITPINNQPPTITTTSLPQGQQGSSYSAALAASGGTLPYTWSITAGNPPSGLTLSSTGQLSGLPLVAGTYNLTISVTDANALSAHQSFTVSISAGGNYDGPAELPRVTVSSSMASTPAPGHTIAVSAGGDLQAALNNASCGDTIALQAGATFHGKYVFPAKACDDNHWIIVRTSAPDSALPAEGQRLTPCYAGVASLPGRPAYPCSNAQNVLARLLLDLNGDGAIRLADGANHYRILGLELTRPVGMPRGAKLIMALGVADHIVLDRSWLHGTIHDETHAGISLSGVAYAAVIDSYFNDLKCISIVGTCTDAHAVSGGVSNSHDGPFLIQNNFLEASGEAVMFGGGAATATPTDIQILNNHFWKPWQWMPGNPNFVGGPDGHAFIVKNHFELKNAVRVLVEANLMENSWGGFSQTGPGIVLTPKNSYGLCPTCQVTDVTIRYVHISHGGSGIQMATALSGDGVTGFPALAGTRWSLHDVLIDDLSKKYVGGGAAFEVMNTWPQNALTNVTINHITAFPDPSSHLLVIGNINYTTTHMYGFVFTNNLVLTGQYPVWNSGGSTSCAIQDVPITTIHTCFTTYTFSNNALIGTPSAFPSSKWPSPNMFPASVTDVGFMNYNNANGGNYELQSTSIYKDKGTDGKDLGADIAGLNAALANVE